MLLKNAGFMMNEEGGLTKVNKGRRVQQFRFGASMDPVRLTVARPCYPQVSPDGLLLQSSTLADRVPFTFCNGETEMVPGE